MSDRIAAGDIDRFVYCPLNWKRAKEGTEGVGGQAGVATHRQRSERVDRIGALQRDAVLSIETAFLLALFTIGAAVLGIELVFLEAATAVYWVLVFLSVLWCAGALYLLAFHLFFRGRADQLGRSARVVRGDVQYVDTEEGGRPQLMQSKTLPVEGRPDYVVERDGRQVPVEVKSGRTPKRPYESHVLQLAAYCHLIESQTGSRPEHGIIEYPERKFEVPYTDRVEDELVRTLLRIQLAQRTGEAHRDHRSKARCAGCARRHGCPERLDVPPSRAGGSAEAVSPDPASARQG